MYHPKGSIDPAILRSFRSYFEQGYDLVIASRLVAGGVNEEDEKILRPRKWFVELLGMIAAVLWKRRGIRIRDVLHGCRGMRRDRFFAIEPLLTGVSMDLEIVVRCYRCGLRAIEFSVVERVRLSGERRFKALPTGAALIWYVARELRRQIDPSASLEAISKGERDGICSPASLGRDLSRRSLFLNAVSDSFADQPAVAASPTRHQPPSIPTQHPLSHPVDKTTRPTQN
jgi:hypothetical protein